MKFDSRRVALELDRVQRVGLGLSEQRLQFGEGPLDRIESGESADRGGNSPCPAGSKKRACTSPPLGPPWQSNLVWQLSEVRLVCGRDRSVFFGTVFMRIFGADIFRPAAEYASVGFGRGPSGREDAFVLDREMEL